MPFAGTARLVKTHCDGGATVDFRVTYGDEHISHGVVVSFPEMLGYLAARLQPIPPHLPGALTGG